ncbi:MAG: PAS domain S-box protein [Dehalococcoidia bacterium]|nr:MAG: PAS domain S-box protein [Dehalococcoidia bacterium]
MSESEPREPKNSRPAPSVPEWVSSLRSDEGLFVADEHQRIVAWSPSAEEALGYKAEEVLGRPCYEVVAGKDIRNHPVCRPQCTAVVNALRGRVTAPYDLASLMSKEGERVWVNNSIVLARDDAGRPLIVHLFRPVKQRAEPLPSARVPSRGEGRRTEAEPGALKPLSRRELEALRMLAGGLSTNEIATAMTISPLTARNHISTIMRKLGARNRVECLIIAAERQLI